MAQRTILVGVPMTVEDDNLAAGTATAGEQWQVAVDAETCIGSGRCSHMAPDYFELDNGHSRVIKAVVRPNEPVLDAAESCPMEAISVTDPATGRLIAPQP